MAVTRLERKGRKNKAVSKKRTQRMKLLNATPVIKKVDIEKLKEEFKEKAAAKKAPKAKKEEAPKAEAAVEATKEAKPKKKAAPMLNAIDVNTLSDSFIESGSARMQKLTASVDTGATAATYTINVPTTIESNNVASKVAISLSEFKSHFRYSAVPKLSTYTYLKAKFTNNTEYTFLPGEVNVFLDNNFIATSDIDLITPDASEWIFLGIDEGIEVKRKLLHDKKGESGLIGRKRAQTFEYIFEITNNKKTGAELVIWDQLPISENEDIEVELITPKDIKDNPNIVMNEYNYIEWKKDLQPGKKIQIPFKFIIEHPKDMNVMGL